MEVPDRILYFSFCPIAGDHAARIFNPGAATSGYKIIVNLLLLWTRNCKYIAIMSKDCKYFVIIKNKLYFTSFKLHVIIRKTCK